MTDETKDDVIPASHDINGLIKLFTGILFFLAALTSGNIFVTILCILFGINWVGLGILSLYKYYIGFGGCW